MLISGQSKRLDVKDLMKHTKYIGGYSEKDGYIKTFWKMVDEEFSDDDQAKFLLFVTSCTRPPLMGFRSMQPMFSVSHMESDSDRRLPTAQTCFNIFRLPKYSSKAIMKEKLLYAIHSNAGFELA